MIPKNTAADFRLEATAAQEQILGRLKGDFQDGDYRRSYVEAELAARVATQIRRLREDRGWTQKELAEKAGTKQSAISKLEDPGYGRCSLSVLQKLAEVFDVALDVAFVPFSAAARKAVSRPEELSVPSFADDAFFAPDPDQESLAQRPAAGTGHYRLRRISRKRSA